MSWRSKHHPKNINFFIPCLLEKYSIANSLANIDFWEILSGTGLRCSGVV